MIAFKSKTARSVFSVHIKAPVDKVFPLYCPVEEYKWVPGWKCNLIHCPNGRVEQGTIFSEISTAPILMGSFKGKTTWTAVVHDSENYKVHYSLENSISSALYKAEFEDNGNGETEGKLDFTYNAINEKGNRLIERNLKEKIHALLSVTIAMLKHYCETNKMLSFLDLQKMVLLEQRLSAIDKILLALNRLAVLNMKDEDRARFMRQF